MIQSLTARQNQITLKTVAPAVPGIEFHIRLNLSENLERKN
jgi:hypothetical protein